MRSSIISIGNDALASQYNNLHKDAFAAAHLLPHEQATPDLTLKVESGIGFVGSTKIVFAGGNSPSFTAPVTNPRIDLLTIDNAGVLARVVGTEAASPSVPAYPADKIILCEVFNRVGQTTIRDADTAGQGYIQRDSRPYLRAGVVDTDSAQTVNGIKTFGSIPILPASDPTASEQAARKAYVDSKETPTGGVLLWTTNTAPTGFLLCDGAAVSRTTYSVLFAVIGTTYGAGDGSTTFNLPNLKGKVPVGRDAAQTEFDVLAETGGEKIHVLTAAEMPVHTHSFPIIGSGGSTTVAGQGTGGTGGSVSPANAGGDAAHQNMPPYIVLNFIIKI